MKYVAKIEVEFEFSDGLVFSDFFKKMTRSTPLDYLKKIMEDVDGLDHYHIAELPREVP